MMITAYIGVIFGALAQIQTQGYKYLLSLIATAHTVIDISIYCSA